MTPLPVIDDIRTTAPDGRPDTEQPAWRRDFPIDVPQDNYVARRDFTRFLGLTSLAFVVGQFWIALQSWLRGQRGEPEPRWIASVDSVPVGGAVTFTFPDPSEPCLLLRPSAESFLAYNQKCTHLSCAVLPRMSDGRIECPCHRGLFDLTTGRPLAGPPRRPLTRIEIERRGNELYAIREELRTV